MVRLHPGTLLESESLFWPPKSTLGSTLLELEIGYGNEVVDRSMSSGCSFLRFISLGT